MPWAVCDPIPFLHDVWSKSSILGDSAHMYAMALAEEAERIMVAHGITPSDARRMAITVPKFNWNIHEYRADYLKAVEAECKRITALPRCRRYWWRFVDWMMRR
jgi:adenosine deaminase